ncbi:hypothetical protein [Streptomyces sp. NBC_01477]|uniref:hypothetical protein n=1 Tax=Streptomyces sp. NBC_01477 TaxID=2976015 RepID=UPI002E30FC6D|nr:hypothetical protein [Streptomyces sp. NBC_01477]
MTAGSEQDLDPAVRDALAADLLAALHGACPGSTAELRGSLATGTADRYSDIDIAWEVPAADFGRCVERVRRTLGRVGPLISLRSDPEYADAPGHRLVFAAFRGLPLFWRLDLDVRADRRDEASAPAASAADPWSPAASALANAVAVVKAVRRGRPDTARGLLERGLLRIGAEPLATGHWLTDLKRLTAAATAVEPRQGPLAASVDALAAGLLPDQEPGVRTGVEGGGDTERCAPGVVTADQGRPKSRAGGHVAASGDRAAGVVGDEAALEKRDQRDRGNAGEAAADHRGGR